MLLYLCYNGGGLCEEKGLWLMLFSECIKGLRKKSILTQEAFAKDIGVVSATVNRWKTGRAKTNMIATRSIKDFRASHNCPYDEIESCWLDYLEC